MKASPRIIQTARSADLSSFSRASASNLRLLHPEWEYLFFDDKSIDSFIRNDYPKYRATFDSFPRNIQRIDFFRYLAVYHYGGFYFDLDVFLWKDLSPLLEHECVFPFEELTLSRHLRTEHNLDWELGNYAFGAAPKHPFLLAIIENCVRAQKDPNWLAPMMKSIPRLFQQDFAVLNSTGPGLVTRTYAENPQLAQSVTVLFPDDVRDPESWHHFGDYGVHIMQGSWRDKGNFIRRRLANRWEASIQKKFAAQSHKFGKTRTYPFPNGVETAG